MQDKSVVLKWSNINTKLRLVQIEKSNFQIQNEVSPVKSTSSSTESVVFYNILFKCKVFLLSRSFYAYKTYNNLLFMT